MNFRQLDLNLLRVLAAIHRTRSVTEAGKALALSQSATSNALARLRRFFDDELFVRSPDGLQPTRRCELVAPGVLEHLRLLETLVTGQEHFDAASSDVHWRLSLSDLGEMLFLPVLASALRERAPHAHLANVSVPVAGVPAALEAREIDCAIGILHARHRDLRADLLFREQYVALTSPGWRPASGRAGATLSPAQLAGASIVVASPTATFHDSVEQMLAKARLAQHVVVRARHFGALPDLARSTDLLAIVPDMYARQIGARHELRRWRLPQAPRYDVQLVWHASTARDPAHQWMRTLIRRLFGRTPPTRPWSVPAADA